MEASGLPMRRTVRIGLWTREEHGRLGLKALDSDSITVRHTTLANTGGTDHLAFDALRIPGFQFIQDPIEYDTRTHHSNMDVYERILPADMRHNAVVLAAFVYLTANRPELLPRKVPPPATP